MLRIRRRAKSWPTATAVLINFICFNDKGKTHKRKRFTVACFQNYLCVVLYRREQFETIFGIQFGSSNQK